MPIVAVSVCTSTTYFLMHSCFCPDISEAKILAAANQFMALGLKAAGYQYINVDVPDSASLTSLPYSSNRIAGLCGIDAQLQIKSNLIQQSFPTE